MMTPMTRAAAEAAAKKIVETRSPRIWNGTVTSYNSTTNIALVVLDGDSQPIEGVVAATVQPEPGDRVLVILSPPSAAFIIGTLTATEPSSGVNTVTTIIQEAPGGGGGGSDFPDGITIGGTPVTITPPGIPSGLVAVPGALSDQSFVDLSWNPTATASSYQVELARRTAPATYTDPYQQFAVVSPSLRAEALTPGANYGVRVAALNNLGVTGAFSAWVDFTAAADTTAPPQVTGVVASRGPSSIIVSWNASTADDVKNGRGQYEAQLSINNFTSVAATALVGGVVHVFSGWNVPQVYYVRVRAIDQSGNPGPFSTIVSTTAGGITGTMILTDAIGSDQLGPGSVTPSEIGFTVGGGNLVNNSGFENTINYKAGWVIGGGGDTEITGRMSPSAIRITNGFAQQSFTLPAGTYTFSAYVAANALTSTTFGLTVSGTVFQNEVISVTAHTSGWTRRVLTFTMPTSGNVNLAINGQGAGTMDVDDVQLEVGSLVTAYAPKTDEILPGSIGSTEIADNAIIASKILAGEIKANHIGANEIIAGKIAVNAISATNIQAGAVTTDKLTVAQAGDNQIINGDFQGVSYIQGVHTFPEAWGYTGSIPGGVLMDFGVGAHGLGLAARISGGQGNIISKGFPVTGNYTYPGQVTAGKTYMWSVRFLAEATLTTGIFIQANVMSAPGTYSFGSPVQSITLVNNVGGTANTWNYAEGKFVATTNGYVTIRLATLSGAGTTAVRFDEVTVRPVERSVTIADGAIDAVNITANAIRTTHILADQIVTGHIAFGSLDGDRIATNSLEADKIATGTLTATTITLGSGGQLMAGTGVGGGGTGLLINDNGVSLYNGAVRTVHLNAATGTATFTGIVNATGGQFTGALTSTATITGGTFITTDGYFRANDSFGGYARLGFGSTEWLAGGQFSPGYANAFATSGTIGYLRLNAPAPTSGASTSSIFIWGGGKRDIELFTPSGEVVVKNNFQVDGTSQFWDAVVVESGYLGTVDGLLFGTRNQEGDWDELAVRSIGSGTTAGISLHSQQYNSAAMVKWDGQSGSLFLTNTGDTNGIPVYALSYNIVSSETAKRDISTSALDMSKFSQLTVREFQYKKGPTCTNCVGKTLVPPCQVCGGTGDSRLTETKTAQDRKRYGLIAEELAQVYPELVEIDVEGNPSALALDQLIALLLQKTLEQDSKIKSIEQKVK